MFVFKVQKTALFFLLLTSIPALAQHQANESKEWWIANNYYSFCLKVAGPAEKLDEFIGYSDKPYTRDFMDSQGDLYKVEVINPVRGGEQVWVYYKSQSACEAEQINATKSLADKYR